MGSGTTTSTWLYAGMEARQAHSGITGTAERDWAPLSRPATRVWIAEFERARFAERVKVGMQRAKSAGRHVGRRRRDVSDEEIAAVADLSLRRAANALGLSKSFLHTWRLSRRVV